MSSFMDFKCSVDVTTDRHQNEQQLNKPAIDYCCFCNLSSKLLLKHAVRHLVTAITMNGTKRFQNWQNSVWPWSDLDHFQIQSSFSRKLTDTNTIILQTVMNKLQLDHWCYENDCSIANIRYALLSGRMSSLMGCNAAHCCLCITSCLYCVTFIAFVPVTHCASH